MNMYLHDPIRYSTVFSFERETDIKKNKRYSDNQECFQVLQRFQFAFDYIFCQFESVEICYWQLKKIFLPSIRTKTLLLIYRKLSFLTLKQIGRKYNSDLTKLW